MKVLDGVKLEDKKIQTYVALGSFDGLHKGHLSLINKIKELAKKNNGKSMVITFKNHPLSLINPDITPKLIMDIDSKIRVLEKNEVDYLALIEFTTEVMKMQPEEFIKYIKENFNVEGIVVGFNFKFGYKNLGDVNLLKELSSKYNYKLEVIDAYTYGEEVVSSTRIRRLIKEGRVSEVKDMLGEYYSITGVVVHGKKIGRTIGFPTANLSFEKDYVVPEKGVYYTKIKHNNKFYKGITSVGYNPTVNGKELTIETYILDFEKEIYGEKLKVEFIERIRGEMKFNSLEELKDQINRDKLYAINKKNM